MSFGRVVNISFFYFEEQVSNTKKLNAKVKKLIFFTLSKMNGQFEEGDDDLTQVVSTEETLGTS